jgi:polar amino acid transport system substrate-binding protein
MKFRVALLALMASMTFAMPARAEDIAVTIYGDAGYPPYSYAEQGKPAGLYYEIVKVAVARMQGYKVEIKPIPWKRGMAMLESGTAFALYPPYLNTKDEPFTWPYSLPLYEEHVVAFCRKDVVGKKKAMEWPKDFFGLRIGNNAGFIVGGVAFDQAVKEGKITLEEAQDNRANLIKLGLKRLDCYINDRQAILWTKQTLEREGAYDEGGKHAQLVEAAVIGVEQGFLGYTDRDKGKFAFKTDFARKFDTVIYQMKRQGEIERIAQKYFKGKQVKR